MNICYKFMRNVFGIILILFVSTTVSDANSSAPLIIVGFGDSITAGVPFIDGKNGEGRRIGGYEPTLESLMGNSGRVVYVFNHGVGGERTPDGVNRIDSVLLSQPSKYILIMEGTNDHWFGISPQTTAFNIGEMIDKSRAKHITPIIGNLTPASRDKKNDIPHIYNPAIESVVTAKEAHFVDHYQATVGNWENLEHDSVHPNQEGYRVLAKNWFDKIIEILPSSGTWIYLLLLDSA